MEPEGRFWGRCDLAMRSGPPGPRPQAPLLWAHAGSAQTEVSCCSDPRPCVCELLDPISVNIFISTTWWAGFQEGPTVPTHKGIHMQVMTRGPHASWGVRATQELDAGERCRAQLQPLLPHHERAGPQSCTRETESCPNPGKLGRGLPRL